VTERAMRLAQRYETTIDRAGLALALGAALGGALVMLLVLAGGQTSPLALVVAWLIGTPFVGIAITAVAGPLWLVFHVAGLRRGRYAALVGGVTALAIFIGGQTGGFGLFGMPAMDGRTLAARWISAVLVSLLVAFFSAAIGVAMWRVAYRRVIP
jgi:hypothetical protein